jgi:hypothetical protein
VLVGQELVVGQEDLLATYLLTASLTLLGSMVALGATAEATALSSADTHWFLAQLDLVQDPLVQLPTAQPFAEQSACVQALFAVLVLVGAVLLLVGQFAVVLLLALSAPHSLSWSAFMPQAASLDIISL